MDYSKYLLLINGIHILMIVVEYFVSIKKNDGVHTLLPTASNTAGLIYFRITAASTNLVIVNIVFALIAYFGISIQPISAVSVVAAIFLIDFMYYVYHMAHHKFEFLWLFHSVHHGDHTFNLSTAFRTSWLLRTYYPFLFLIPLIPLGFSPATVIIGLALHYDLSTRIQHAAYLRKKSFLDYIFITPYNHSIHHDHDHQQYNFGGILSVWDRIFGTYIDEIPKFSPGIRGYRQDNIILMQTDPFVKYIKKLISKKNA